MAEPPRQWYGYGIAICVYAGGYALLDRSNLTAGAICAMAAFLFAWEWNLPPADRARSTDRGRAVLRLARVALPAILVTAWALMMGERQGNEAAAMADLTNGSGAGTGDAKRVASVPGQGVGGDGYESIILSPFPEKKQIVPPLPVESDLWAPGSHRPLVIRFNGEYWYFQPPGLRPGSRAHHAQGTPLEVHVQSANALPLTMRAHQKLAAPVRLSRCGEIQVGIENRDNVPGTIAMALLLTDSASPKSSLYLGSKILATSEPPQFAIKTAPVAETLRFPLPTAGQIRRFDEITVLLLPDVEHRWVGSKISIRQFELIPR